MDLFAQCATLLLSAKSEHAKPPGRDAWIGRPALVRASARDTLASAGAERQSRRPQPARPGLVRGARGAACAARPGFGAVLGWPSHAPRSATVRGLGAADMLARNPRGEDTRWQSG